MNKNFISKLETNEAIQENSNGNHKVKTFSYKR